MELRSSLFKKAVWGGLVIASIATIGFANAQGWGQPGLGRDGDRIMPMPGGDNIQPAPIVPLAAGDGSWNADASDVWSNSARWLSSAIADGAGATGNFTFDITLTRTITIDGAVASRTLGIMNIGDPNGTNSYTIAASGGGTLTFNNSGSNAQLNQTSTSANTTISAPISLSDNLDIKNDSANNLTLSGGISAGTAGTKTVTTSSGTVTVSSGVISDGSGVVAVAQKGPGTLALGTLANTYSGGTTISGGKITIGGSGTPLGSGSLTLSGGTLVSSASRTATATNVVVTADSALTTTSNAAGGANMPFSGTLTGSAGTLTIRNDGSSTTGQFDVRFSGGDYTMSRPIVLDNGASTGTARLSDFNATGSTHTYSNIISGNGNYNRSVSSGTGGTTVFTAANTYTGSTTVNNGVLSLGDGGTTGSLSTSSAVTMNAAGTFTINRSNAVAQGTDFTGSALTGAGKFAQAGAGTTTLNIANSYSGGTIVSGGTLIASADGALGTGSVSLTAASVTLTLQSGATNNYIADTASISIVTGATANLNFTTTVDIVNGITLGGVVQTSQGTYGAIGSGANFESAFFTGTGMLDLVPEPATYMLLGVGLLICAQRMRRKRV